MNMDEIETSDAETDEIIESFRKELESEANELNRKFREEYNLKNWNAKVDVDEINMVMKPFYYKFIIQITNPSSKDIDRYTLITEVRTAERLYKFTGGVNMLTKNKQGGYIDFNNEYFSGREREDLDFSRTFASLLADAENIELDGKKVILNYPDGGVTDCLRNFAESKYMEFGID